MRLARKSLKQIAKQKAKAELREAKARIKELRNPFQKYMAITEKLDKISEALVYGGLAVAGLQHFRDWKGALFGPIALKLATADNIVSGTAGVAGLSLLGLGLAGPDLKEWVLDETTRAPDQDLIDRGLLPEGSYPINPQHGTCPIGFTRETFGYRYHAWCVPIPHAPSPLPPPIWQPPPGWLRIG